MSNKIKYILGIQSYANHDAGASILKFDNYGKVLEYISITEDRTSKKKTYLCISCKFHNVLFKTFQFKEFKKNRSYFF